MKFIGVLGGMGPTSSVLFYRMLIEECQKIYGAKKDEDYPKILIYNLPTPGGISGTLHSRDFLLKVLTEGVKFLERCGVDIICIPCASVHCFIEELIGESEVPMMNMIEIAAKNIFFNNIERVGLLATKACIFNKVFQKEFEKRGIETLVPDGDELDALEKIIWDVYEFKFEKNVKRLKNIVENLLEKGAECIVIGCTELSYFQDKLKEFPIVDCMRLLAQETIRFSLSRELSNLQSARP